MLLTNARDERLANFTVDSLAAISRASATTIAAMLADERARRARHG